MPRSVLYLPLVLWLTACQAESESMPETDLRWSEPVKVASGEAYQGPWRMNESEFLYVDDPAVALADGKIFFAWVDNADQDIHFQIFDRDGEPELDEPVNVSVSGDIFSWLPRVAVDGERVYIAWEEVLFTGGSHGGEILLARSNDGGRSFSEPINLSNTTAGAGKGRLTRERWDNGSLDLLARNGRVVVAWTEYEGALRVATSADGGDSFGEPLHVAGDDELPARAPSLAGTPDDRIWLAWTVGEDNSADIHLAYTIDTEEGFSEPRRIHASDAHADSPVVRVDSEGTVHLAWTESTGGPLRGSRIVYARDIDGSGDFGETVRLSGDTMAVYPQMAVAGQRVLVSWERSATDRRQLFGIGYSASVDGGRSFSEPTVIAATQREEYGVNGGNQGLLMRKLDLSDDGRAVLGHATFNRNEASHIWLLRGRVE
ncbi:exo-alpha-sialidase [Wenzhouxiangella sp. AB-CW3]|uniref:sialidase family protein n=1 Tax=Wenzhouxiangella sp. AB-CW3 TaxID=2771012 RepID=UPI00168BBE26|nr:sialidase family protein [Wenzhouxiangella sp. AB-CW3]QOC22644.1 exo-alpha-sialidase [Wenzhouxiangella sp. AB-CW3]